MRAPAGVGYCQAVKRQGELGICMGLLMGIAFGLFDSRKGVKEDE